MNEEFIIATIVDGNQTVETRRCRRAQLPDGSSGALWRGLVWPLASGDKIDIAGPGFPLLPEDLSSGPRFGLVDGAEEAWLVLEGSVTVRESAARLLREAGVEILRTGAWLGDPVDGVFGTSFIRFVRPSTENLSQAIAEILESSLSPGRPSVDLAERLRLLTVELTEARAAIACAHEAQRAPQPKSLAEIESELARVKDENLGLLQEMVDLRRQVEEIPVRPVFQPSRAAVVRLQDEIAVLMASIRPDIRFLRDSLTVASGEFADRQSLCRAIVELKPDTLGPSWKRIRDAAGWWERHISNGQDDSGRLYARRAGTQWEILLSHKSQQKRDLAWISRYPPS
jgi:hypothetical protein